MALSIATCIAPVNIAVVKYWGKSEEGDIRLIRPINSSLSGTLDMSMHSRTTVAVGSQLSSDRLWLNGKEEDVGSDRVQNCLRGVRQLAVSRGGRPAELAKVLRKTTLVLFARVHAPGRRVSLASGLCM